MSIVSSHIVGVHSYHLGANGAVVDDDENPVTLDANGIDEAWLAANAAEQQRRIADLERVQAAEAEFRRLLAANALTPGVDLQAPRRSAHRPVCNQHPAPYSIGTIEHEPGQTRASTRYWDSIYYNGPKKAFGRAR